MSEAQRSLGLFAATGIGVGAIVGGGILALAGPAFAVAGPGAIIAFSLNGLIAIATALSLAELATRFPESGGLYAFARRVLALEAAFVVGWLVWFASIVAAVLYALGFGSFLVATLQEAWLAYGATPPPWLAAPPTATAAAVAATCALTAGLVRRPAGGGQWVNVVKLVLFGGLITAGAWAVAGQGSDRSVAALRPLLPGGVAGVLTAMGFTFIALQGFDLIAAVGGEVQDPRKNLPRAMLLSLGLALLIYLPLLLVVAAAGSSAGVGIQQASAEAPETIMAIAARRWLGTTGYWLVLLAGILAMFSALHANLLAASRVALAMARDRNLPLRLDVISAQGTPVRAVLGTAGLVVAVTLAVGEVAAAGAAASLAFLFSFALIHLIALLARRREHGRGDVFRVPGGPCLPLAGAGCCGALGIYQAFAVPTAGIVVVAWSAVGVALFVSVLARRSRVRDAAAEAGDPDLLRMRGRAPLALVPIANPANARALVSVASTLAPGALGRVLLLSVVERTPDAGDVGLAISSKTAAIGRALERAWASGIKTEALVTIADDPWHEVVRVARLHRCACILLGMSNLDDDAALMRLEQIAGAGPDVAVLRAPRDWSIADVSRVLAPVAGGGGHDVFRARVVTRLLRSMPREIRYLEVLAPGAHAALERKAASRLNRRIEDEAGGMAEAIVARGDVLQTLVSHAASADLVVLGLEREGRARLIGPFIRRFAAAVDTPLLLITHRG